MTCEALNWTMNKGSDKMENTGSYIHQKQSRSLCWIAAEEDQGVISIRLLE